MSSERNTPDRSEPEPIAGVDYESEALERGSYVTAIIHLYRGEVSRANTWRQRLDQSTNWAVFVTASALGFAFGNEAANHFSLLFANIVLLILLGLEARRFRFFDVWRSRIRKIETNFFAPILRRELTSPEQDWMLLVAEDLRIPHFHLTRLQAFRLRLVRNYLQIFAVVLLAWIIKLAVHPERVHSWGEIYQRCSVGPIPGWVTLVTVAIFYGGLVAVVVLGRSDREGRDNWDIGERVGE
ncbi:MAG: DUF2270 domain-containing protein [Planctomycetota bacterium]